MAAPTFRFREPTHDRHATPRPLPVAVGRAENALRALLLDILGGSPLHRSEEWIALNLVADPTPTDDVVNTVSRSAAVTHEQAVALLDDLVRRGLLTGGAGGYGPPHAVVFATTPIAFALRDVVPGTDLDAVAQPGIGAAIWLHATDVQAVHDALVADGHTIVSAPIDGPFGRTFTFADPDGYRITLHDGA